MAENERVEVRGFTLDGVHPQLVTLTVTRHDEVPGRRLVDGLAYGGVGQLVGALRSARVELPPGEYVVDASPAPRDWNSLRAAVLLGLVAHAVPAIADRLRRCAVAADVGSGGKFVASFGTYAFMAAAASADIDQLIVGLDDECTTLWRVHRAGSMAEAPGVVTTGSISHVERLSDALAVIAVPAPPNRDFTMPFAGWEQDGSLMLSDREVTGFLAAATCALPMVLADGFLSPTSSLHETVTNQLGGLLPVLTPDEAVEVAALHSVLDEGDAVEPSIARPYQVVSSWTEREDLFGGSASPGAVAEARHGVLLVSDVGGKMPEADAARLVAEAWAAARDGRPQTWVVGSAGAQVLTDHGAGPFLVCLTMTPGAKRTNWSLWQLRRTVVAARNFLAAANAAMSESTMRAVDEHARQRDREVLVTLVRAIAALEEREPTPGDVDFACSLVPDPGGRQSAA